MHMQNMHPILFTVQEDCFQQTPLKIILIIILTFHYLNIGNMVNLSNQCNNICDGLTADNILLSPYAIFKCLIFKFRKFADLCSYIAKLVTLLWVLTEQSLHEE